MTLPVIPSPRLPKAKLLTLVKTIAEVQTVWNTGSRGLLGYRPGTERAWILVGMQGWRELGTDELRVEWNAAENRNDEIVMGQRTFTMTLQSFSLDASLEAFDLLERVRFRMRSETARAIMVPTLALKDFKPIQTLPNLEAQAGNVSHIVLRASLDVGMNCVVGTDPNDPGEGHVIESVTVATPTVGGNLIP